MNRQILIIFFLAGVIISGLSTAQQSDANYNKYQATRDLAVDLYIAAYTNYRDRLLTVAILQACNKSGIANSIDVTPFEAGNFMVDEMKKLLQAGKKHTAILTTLTATESVNVISSVNDQLIAYKLGYSESTGVVKNLYPAICEVGMQGADQILKRKEKK